MHTHAPTRTSNGLLTDLEKLYILLLNELNVYFHGCALGCLGWRVNIQVSEMGKQQWY